MKEAKNHLAIYDLKGSTVKRLVKDNEIESARTTLKDVNLLRDPRNKLNWLNFRKSDIK